MIVLQSSSQDTLGLGSGPESGSLDIIDLILKGGIFMVPLILLSIIGLYIFIERWLSIRNASKMPPRFTEQIRNMVLDGNIQGAKQLCNQTQSPVARMIEKGINRIGSPLKNIEAAIENLGKIEIYRLERNLQILGTISGAAPMVGFLGTVTGMIQAFQDIASVEGAVSPKLLSTGIYEALITTASGLIIGILAYLGYNFLIAQVQKVVHRMEYSSIDFMDLLQEPQK
jgi:biopolymer transport protein ExbB